MHMNGQMAGNRKKIRIKVNSLYEASTVYHLASLLSSQIVKKKNVGVPNLECLSCSLDHKARMLKLIVNGPIIIHEHLFKKRGSPVYNPLYLPSMRLQFSRLGPPTNTS